MFPWGLVKKTHFNNACSTISSARKGRSTVTVPGQIIIFKKENPPSVVQGMWGLMGCRGKREASTHDTSWLLKPLPHNPDPPAL